MPRVAGINHLTAIRALEKAGFQIIRQGKHVVMSDGTRQVTLPRHNPIKAFTMGGIVRDAGLTVEAFRELLQVISYCVKTARVNCSGLNAGLNFTSRKRYSAITLPSGPLSSVPT